MHEIFIPLILGTAREGRQSEKVAQFVYRQLQSMHEVEPQFIDVRDFLREPRTYSPSMKYVRGKVWQEVAERADGFIIVTPEYNHGYPGELKLLLDMAEKEYDKKVMGMVGVSSGYHGGVRVVEQMQAMFTKLGMISVPKPLLFGNVEEVFDENGQPFDPKFHDRTENFLKQVIEYTRGIKKMREAK